MNASKYYQLRPNPSALRLLNEIALFDSLGSDTVAWRAKNPIQQATFCFCTLKTNLVLILFHFSVSILSIYFNKKISSKAPLWYDFKAAVVCCDFRFFSIPQQCREVFCLSEEWNDDDDDPSTGGSRIVSVSLRKLRTFRYSGMCIVFFLFWFLFGSRFKFGDIHHKMNASTSRMINAMIKRKMQQSLTRSLLCS